MESPELQAIIDRLHKTHVTISLSLMLTLLLVAGAGMFLYVHSNAAFERALGQAQAREQKYNADMKDLQAQWATDRSKLLELAQQKAQIQTQIVTRNAQADAKIKEVTQPQRPPEVVQADFTDAYGFKAQLTNGQFVLDIDAIQQIVATKVDRDRLDFALKSTQQQLTTTETSLAIVSKSLEDTKGLLKEANATIDGYKKAANKSKFMKFLGGVEKVGLVVGGIWLGRHI